VGLNSFKLWLMAAVNNELFIIIGKKASDFLFPGRPYNELIFNDNEIDGKLAVVLPHPSPLNIKWFKDHPEFEAVRLPVIRKYLWDSLNM
jgi:uracil-DNA glycosylase